MALVESVAVLLLGNQFPLWAASIFPLALRGGGEERSEAVGFFPLRSWQQVQPCTKVRSCRSNELWSDLLGRFMARGEVQLRWTGEVRSHFCLLPIPFPLLLSEAAVPSLHMQPAASNSQNFTSGTCGGWPGDSLVSPVVPRPRSQTQSAVPCLK